MSSRIKLTVTLGDQPEGEFVFGDRTICTVGRAPDCLLRLPDDIGHATVSRHHCVFEIDPPTVAVMDIGSRNGTFVNGEPIGRCVPAAHPGQVAVTDWPVRRLRDGDEVRLGDVVVRVGVCAPAEGEWMHAGGGV